MSGGVLLVGERLGRERWRPKLRATDDVDLRLRVGGFETPESRRNLERVGIEWDACANLLWPEGRGQVAEWDKPLARHVAGLLLARDYDAYVLCGRRVADAFWLGAARIPSLWTLGAKRVLVIPHPSGLNRLWNDPLVREEVAEMWSEVEEVVSCASPT